MSDQNLYAAPSAGLDTVDSSDFQIVGGKLMGVSPLDLPEEVCVGCGSNNSHTVRHQKKLYWATPLIYFFILINILAVAIAYLVARKKLELSFSLCHDCDAKRKQRLAIQIAVELACVLAFFSAFGFEGNTQGALFVTFGVLFIGSLILAFLFAAPLRVAGYEKGNQVFSLKGKGVDRLAEGMR